MSRLLRILLNAATVLSLVLCMATMAAWVRSYRARDAVYWSRANPRMQMGIATYRGGLFAGVFTPLGADDGLLPPGAGWSQRPPVTYAETGASHGTFWNLFGFSLEHRQYREDERRYLAC